MTQTDDKLVEQQPEQSEHQEGNDYQSEREHKRRTARFRPFLIDPRVVVHGASLCAVCTEKCQDRVTRKTVPVPSVPAALATHTAERPGLLRAASP